MITEKTQTLIDRALDFDIALRVFDRLNTSLDGKQKFVEIGNRFKSAVEEYRLEQGIDPPITLQFQSLPEDAGDVASGVRLDVVEERNDQSNGTETGVTGSEDSAPVVH